MAPMAALALTAVSLSRVEHAFFQEPALPGPVPCYTRPGERNLGKLGGLLRFMLGWAGWRWSAHWLPRVAPLNGFVLSGCCASSSSHSIEEHLTSTNLVPVLQPASHWSPPSRLRDGEFFGVIFLGQPPRTTSGEFTRRRHPGSESVCVAGGGCVLLACFRSSDRTARSGDASTGRRRHGPGSVNGWLFLHRSGA